MDITTKVSLFLSTGKMPANLRTYLERLDGLGTDYTVSELHDEWLMTQDNVNCRGSEVGELMQRITEIRVVPMVGSLSMTVVFDNGKEHDPAVLFEWLSSFRIHIIERGTEMAPMSITSYYDQSLPRRVFFALYPDQRIAIHSHPVSGRDSDVTQEQALETCHLWTTGRFNSARGTDLESKCDSAVQLTKLP